MTYQYDLFISYCRRDDEEFVRCIYEDLTEKGFKVWWDRESMPSRALTFLQEIRDAIDDSCRLIAVVGPEAVKSDYVLQEWTWASQFGNGIVPILRLGDYNLLPEDFANFHCLDFRSDSDIDYSKHFSELCRILAEPLKPLGILYKVPSLPPHFLYRKKVLDKMTNIILADIREPTLRKSTLGPLVVYGMGGIGKSVLASALARTIDTRRAFTDGIFWLTIGQKPDLLGNFISIGTVFNDDLTKYNDLINAQIHLVEDIHDKKVLIILDDVWEISHIEFFLNVMGPHCRLLLTTRDEELATILDVQKLHLDILSDTNAVQFLADWVEVGINSLSKTALNVIKECGNHTFALALAGALYKDGTPWKDIHEALCEADLQFMNRRFPNYPHKDVFLMIKLSIDTFMARYPTKAKYYNELVVFRPEEIPENAVMVLWTRINGLKERDARQLLINLKNLSLLRLEGRSPNCLVSLHDLQYDFLCTTINDLKELRMTLLMAYKEKCPKGWHTGPNDGYFFQHIGYIMAKLNCWQELVKTLTDFNFIETCSRNGVIHTLINNYSEILASDDLPKKFRRKIDEFKQFLVNQTYNLQKYPYLTIQQAINHPDSTLPSQIGKEIIKLNNFSQSWIEWINKPQKLDPCILTFFGHTDWVWAVDFSPDGTKVISASSDMTLKLWDVVTGNKLISLIGHSGEVRRCAFSPDGSKIVSASDDKTLKLWDVTKGTEFRTLKGHSDRVYGCGFSPDGTKLISASWDKTLKLWDTETGNELKTFKGHTKWVRNCAFSPDGMKVVSASSDRTLKLWAAETALELRTFIGHSDEVRGCAFSPDGLKIVSASRDKTLKLWDAETGIELKTFTGHSSGVNDCVFSPDGTKILSASWDTTLKLWDLGTGTELTTLKGHSKGVYGCVFSPDGKRLLSASWDKTLKLWDIETSEQFKSFKGHTDRVRGCAFSPDGTTLVTSSDDKTLKVWDIKTLKYKTFTGHSDRVRRCAFSPDGTKVASASWDKTLKLWAVKTGEVLRTFTGHSKGVYGCAFSPDGSKIVSASWDKTLKLWDIESSSEIRTFKGHTGTVWGCAFSPDGSKIISASDDTTLKLWDLKTGAVVRTFIGHSEGVNGCAFSPDGTKIVSASWDRTLKVWNAKTGVLIYTYKGHSDRVWGCAFLSNGKWVVSASLDKTVQLWDVESGDELSIFPTIGSTMSIAININNIIAAGDEGGWVYLLRPHGIN
ncbi:MAG: NB-ARC domain-containing protein [Promethearchaeota archaeon]